MGYKALYRTYRPQFFREVVGQDVVVKTLQNAIASDKVSHAYLFSGPRGTGKTTIARIFAKTLNCANVTMNEPCNNCPSCKEISDGAGIDVVEIDAASNNGVDEIREIRDKVKFLPAGAKYKIYIIDEVHMLSSGAFNALLKTLEEPPKHVIFILATTEPQKLPSTIISRCQRFDFKSLSINEISHKIREVCASENIVIDEEAIKAISESAEGGLRDALSTLDQAISYAEEKVTVEEVNLVTGNINNDRLIELGLNFYNKDINHSLEIIDALIDSGKEAGRLVSNIIQFYRDMLLYKSVTSPIFTKYIFEKEKFKELSEKVDINHIFYYIDVLSDVQTKMKYSQSPRIYLEVGIIKLINISNEDLDYISRIKELEEKINNIKVGGIGEGGVVDNERLEILELKLNKIVSELNRLNLQSEIERINNLQNLINNFSNVEIKNYDSEILKINNEISNINNLLERFGEYDKSSSDDFLQLKEEIENIKNDLKNIIIKQKQESEFEHVHNNNEFEEIKTELEGLKKLIEDSRNSSISNDIQVDRSEIEKIKFELEEIKTEIKESKLVQASELKTDNIDIEDLKEEIKNIREDLRMIIENSGVNNDEVTLHTTNNEDILDLKNEIFEIKKAIVDIKTEENKEIDIDNEDKFLQLRSDILRIQDDLDRLKVEISKVDNKRFEIPDTELSQKVSQLEKQVYDLIAKELAKKSTVVKKKPTGQVALFDSDLAPIKDFEVKKIEVNFESLKKEHEINTSLKEDNNENMFDQPSAHQEAKGEVDYKVEQNENSDIEEKPIELQSKRTANSELVVKKREERLFERERQLMEEELRKIELVKTNNEISEIFDKFASYNIRAIEELLHDSRKDESRNDAKRIGQLWKNIVSIARPELKGTAEILGGGRVAAVGNKEMILVYKTTALCNQVMRPKFKADAQKLLKDALNDTYNYVALPEYIWEQKRAEYVEQYQMGTKFPKLRPIEDKDLIVISSNKEYKDPRDSIVDKTISFFGEDLIDVE